MVSPAWTLLASSTTGQWRQKELPSHCNRATNKHRTNWYSEIKLLVAMANGASLASVGLSRNEVVDLLFFKSHSIYTKGDSDFDIPKCYFPVG